MDLIKSTALAIFVSIAWYFGAIGLYEIFTDFSNQWHWYVIAATYTLIINEIFIHQIIGHSNKIPNTKTITFKILTFLSSVDHAYGAARGFCMHHKNHHMYSDQDADMVNVKRTWHDAALLSPWIYFTFKFPLIPNYDSYINEQRESCKYLTDDPWTNFCQDYKIVLTIVFWGLLFVFLPVILFKVVFVGRLLISIFKVFADIFGHMKLPGGYRNFDTPDNTYNHLLFHYLSLTLFTAMLHNNHHGTINFKTSQVRWFEFDLSQYIIKSLLWLTNAKTRD